MAQRFSYGFAIILICFIYSSKIIAKNENLTVINDPNVSRRCELLATERLKKLTHKDRILTLIERNKHLQKATPENKVSIKEKLEQNLGHLENELTLATTQIQFQAEQIIRKGCPGISL